jgi:hypothetical protein
MSTNYIFGNPQEDQLGNNTKYFYGLRRTDAGDLYIAKVNQLSKTDSVTINNGGTSDNNMPDFQGGVDFHEGRDVNHNLAYSNLNYEQFRWDDRNIFYYIDADGQLVARINATYTYPTGV